jgi:hypothetical protein
MTKQNNKPDSFAVFALICLGITIIVSITHEIILWQSK